MTDLLPEPVNRILVAVLVGFLIGLERERAEVRKRRRIFAGVRTFPLISLIGALSMLLVHDAGPLLVLGSLIGVAAVSVVSYLRSSARGAVGATTEIAAIATFLLGALAGSGQLLLAGSLGIGVAALLVAKPRLEGFSRAISQDELTAAMELAVIAGIVLPLVPNRSYGPWDVWNPFQIWLVVVLVSAVSFASFVTSRLFGQRRGVVAAGVVGGMVSSTAVTAAMAGRAREEPSLAPETAAAAILASVVMCARIAVFAAAFGPSLLPRLAPVLAAMAAAGIAAAWLAGRGTGKQRRTSAPPATPTSLRTAATFALLYALIQLLVSAARAYYGDAGMMVAAAISGLVDVDAVTIAFTSGARGSDDWGTAAVAISIAAVANTLAKLGMAVVLGEAGFRRRVAPALAAMAAVGTAAAFLLYGAFTSG